MDFDEASALSNAGGTATTLPDGSMAWLVSDAPVAPIDIGARQQAAKIQQQLNTLRQQQQRLQQPGIVDADSQKKIKDLQQQIKKLKQKFSKLQTTDNDVQNIIKLDTSSDQTDATGQGLFSPDQTVGDIFKSVDDTNLSPAAKKKSTKKKPAVTTDEDLTHGLEESGPETWTVYFTDGTTTKIRVPNDEVDPAIVRQHFAKKGKTVKKVSAISPKCPAGFKKK